MKLKEINRTAMLCWSPAQHHPIYLTTGTSAQQLDASFSTSASLELFELNLADPSLDMKSCGTFSSSQRYHKLVWSPFGIDGQGLPSGVLIAGGENGNVILYDPAKILSGNSNVIIAESAMHTGPVRALDVNPFQTNLVASGGNESEVYIWDINNFKSPMTPGPKTQPLEDISFVAWNRQVQHILASTTPSGRTSVWDLRKNDLIIKVCDHSNRMHCSGMAWNPEVATQLLIASEDDRMPVIQMWDLRFASSPLKVLENHTRGVLGVAWSSADPELLLSCGKDGRILCWNPNTAEILYELPTGNQWCFDIQWCPRNPAVFSTAGFNSCIDIYSIMGGTSQAQSQRHVDQISTSFGNMDPFGTGQILPPLELPQSGSVSTTVTPLKKPPKWIQRPVGATFAFGGKLVSLENAKPNPQQPGLRAVHVSQVVTETGLLKRSSQLQDTIHSGHFEEFCRGKINLTENEFEKTVWSFLRANFDPDTRSSFLELLGYNKEQVALKISAALTEKPAEPVADLQATAEDNPEAAFDLIAAANLCPAATGLLSAQSPESVQSQEVKAEDKDVLFMDPNNYIVDHNQETDVSAEQQWDDEEVILEQEVNVMLDESKDLTYYSEPQDLLSEDLQAPTEEPSQDLFQNNLQAPMEEPAPDMFVQDLQPPMEEPAQDMFVQDLQPPIEEAAQDMFPQDLQAPIEEAAQDMFPQDLQAPMEEPAQDMCPVDLQAPMEEPAQDMCPVDLQPSMDEPLQDLFQNDPQAPTEEPSQDLFDQDLQAPTEEPVQDMFNQDLQAPLEEPAQDMCPVDLQAPTEEPSQDLLEQDLQAPTEEPVQYMFPVDLQAPIEEASQVMFPGDFRAPAEEPLQDLFENNLKASMEEPSQDLFEQDLQAPLEKPTPDMFPLDLQAPLEEASQDMFPGAVRAPTEEPSQDLFENDLQPPMEEPAPDMFPVDLQAPLEEPATDMFPVDLQAPLEEPATDMFAGDVRILAEAPSQDLIEEDLQPPIEQPSDNIFPKDLQAPLEEPSQDLIAGGEMLQDSVAEVESSSEDPIEKVFQIPCEQLVIADVPRPSANDVTQITPEVNHNPGLSQDVDELITRALLTGDFEGAVELCLHDNRMADSIILALAGGAELLEKTQKKYFIKSPSKLSKLISAVVMKDLHAIMSTCELQNWKEALASVMTYADTQEFSSLCDLLGGRLEGANDLQLQAQASLCYICAGNLEKLVSCWIKAQERDGLLYLQDLVEKVVVMRHAVETQNSSPLAVGDLLAEKMSEYANLLASQGCLSTAIKYLPDEPSHVCLRLLRERLNCALSRQDPACSKTQSVACKVPPLQTPTAAQSINPYSAVRPISTAPAPAQPHFYQPVRSASTVTSWSNQTPTAFPHVPTGAASDPSKVELPNPMCGMPTTENAAVPSVPFVPSHQYLPQVTQYPQGAGGPRVYRPDQYSSPVTPVLAEASAPPHPPGFLSQYSQHVPPQTSFTPFSSPSASFASPNLFTITSSSTNSAIPPPSIAGFQHSGPGSPGSYTPLPPQNGFSAPQNGWNDPPTLVRGSKKKQVPEYYSPPAPITSPIMAPMGVNLQSPQIQVPSSGHQQPASPFINSMSTSASNSSSEGAPGAPVGDVIQPLQSLPSEQITKTIPEEHLLLKTTFESLIQKCLIKATDPQTKRKLVDANKRLETLYDKLSDRTLSPAIVGGLHNIARSIDSRSYAEALKIHTHIVSSSNFSEISGFMPVLKVVLTQANRLGV